MTVLPQRPLRGSRISSFYPIKSLPSLSSLDSAFQLQEYISLLIRLNVHDVDAIVSLPGKTGKDKEKEGEGDGKEKEKDNVADAVDNTTGEDSEEKGKGKNEVTVDEACWIYEQLRRLAQDLTHPLITMLQQECTRASCPEMKAGEWLYLCVAHGNEGAMEQCCAIDYILHTLDSATALLNTSRAFPSRLQIPQSSHRHFSSLARRLGRIFAHAYFHHREAFEQAEAESSLYARFLALTSKFDLVPPEFLVIPARVTDHENDDRGNSRDRDFDVQPPRLLAAAVGPRAAHEGEPDPASRQQQQQQQQANVAGPYPGQWDRRGSVVPPVVVTERAKDNSPPGLGSESPRKTGRSRTDTMVLHEAFVVAEELGKADRAGAELGEDAANEPSRTMAIDVPDMPDEVLSPTEDFPKTAKPRAETIEETQYSSNSLPESPTIKSPPSTLPEDALEVSSEVHSAEADIDKADTDKEAVVATAASEPIPESEPEVASTSTSASTEPESSPAVPDDVADAEPTALETDISEAVTTAVLPSPTSEIAPLPPSETTETLQLEEEEAAAATKPDSTDEAPVAEKDVAATSETDVDTTEDGEAHVEDIHSIADAVEEIVETPKEAQAQEPKVEAEVEATVPGSDEKASEPETVSEPKKATTTVADLVAEPSDEPSKDHSEPTAPA